MNIVFTTDNQFLQVEVSMTSLLYYNPTSNIYLMTAIDIDNNQLKRFIKIANHFNGTFNIIKVDKKYLPFLNLINNEQGLHQGLGKLLPDSAYYRWLIGRYLFNEDKCLYLDTDIIVNKNLDDIYNQEILTIGAYFYESIRNICSGALLINIKKWISWEIEQKLIDQLLLHHKLGWKISDQAVINELSIPILNIDNFMLLYNDINIIDNSDYYLLHYCDTPKPWDDNQCFYEKNNRWQYFLDMSVNIISFS